MIVTERFNFPFSILHDIETSYNYEFGFGGFGEVTYLRTYSRNNSGKQENWFATCVRTIEGCLSIRKDWYKKIGVRWEEGKWQAIGKSMLTNMYQMKFLAPGRGLWAMGSSHVYEVGSMALNNCAATSVKNETLAEDICWAMDAMMCGCGVGYRLEISDDWLMRNVKQREDWLPKETSSEHKERIFQIPDTRGGWVNSTKMLIRGYFTGKKISFDYSKIRPHGEPIKGFGGVASGPAPLIILHYRIVHYFENFLVGRVDGTRLVCDLINATGACVVSGNVRRGAQIILGSVYNKTFLDLKALQYDEKMALAISDLHKTIFSLSKEEEEAYNYSETIAYIREYDFGDMAYLEDRLNIGGLSNNSCFFETSEDFTQLEVLAEKAYQHADIGMLNIINIRNYGRFGYRAGSNSIQRDEAQACNPCGEIALGNKELCNLVEIFPTRCDSQEELHTVTCLATIYAQTVSLLMTHSLDTNGIVSRNRRIGVSISGAADMLDSIGAGRMTKTLRWMYNIVKRTSSQMAAEAGVPEPIRMTTIKPSGTVSQLAGVSSGMHFPTFQYAIRRIRIAKGSSMDELLQKAGVLWEPDVVSPDTNVFSFPINQGKTRPATSVSAWEQFAFLAMLQREWSDNMVSCTIYWNPETEGDQLEHMLAQFAPLIKSVSLNPHTEVGAYKQMPYEGISLEEYREMKAKLGELDLSSYLSDTAQPENREATLFCENDSCEVV